MKKLLILFLMLFALLIVSCGGSSGDGGDTGDDGDSGSSGADTDSGSTSDTGTDTGVVSENCGNRETDPGEVCDGGTKDCRLIDSGYTDGIAVCKINCSGWDTTACTGIPTNPDTDPDTNDDTDVNDDDSDTNSSKPVDNSDPREGAEVTYIHLNGSTITVDGAHPGDVTVYDSYATITASGVFEVDGTLSDGRLLVETSDSDKEIVQIVFNGVTITSLNSSPFQVKNAKDVRIFTVKGTQNTFTDGTNYSIETYDPDDLDECAAFYSKCDLILAGEGTLNVNGNCNDAIATKDDLDINGGTIVVKAADDGIRGKDSVVIRGGNITVTAHGDGIKSDNKGKLELVEVADDGTVINDAAYEKIKGYVKIKGGSVNVTAENGDGIHAISYIEIQDGIVNITSGGGSVITTSSSGGGWGGGGSAEQKYNGDTSLKGIKASIPDEVEGYADLNTKLVYIKITGGTINVNSRDDAVHSGGLVYIKGGDLTIASDDDGIHADNELMILAGTVNVTMSYEGLEAWYITVSGGVTSVYGRDDGWNAAGGTDGSGSSGGGPGDWGSGGHGSGGPGGGSTPPGGNGSTGYLTITGGFHYIKTGTGDVDGIDSNGTMTITGGVIVVECQINGGQGGSFDSDGAANITSQTLLGFSTGNQKSEKGTDYTMNFNANTIYGNSHIAFKPTISGRHTQASAGQPSVINDVSSYNVQPFPNGLEVYYK